MSRVGEVVHNIRLVELLGVGGMGQVYLGVDEVLGRQVAVKAIRADRRLDASAKGRFLREAQVLSQIDHPRICRIFEYIEADDHDLIVLELVRGENLRQALGRGLSRRKKLAIAEQIAEALVAAHSLSVVHRDLKPENIMITPEIGVKVLDFGLARPVAGVEGTRAPVAVTNQPAPPVDRPESPPSHDYDSDRTVFTPSRDADCPSAAAAMTVLGDVMGTPRFMSPEQARGEAVTAASDMYSFGLVLQALFTGREPYPEEAEGEVLINQVMWGETLPADGVDAGLGALIADLKKFNPGERPSATEAADRLRRVSDRPRRRRRRLVVAAVWLGLLLSTGGMALQSLRAAREAHRAEAEAEAARQVSDFLVDLFEVSDPGEARGSTITARELLDAGARRAEQELAGQPRIRARLLRAIGTVYHQLGLYDQAEAPLRQAVADLDGLDDVPDLELAESLRCLAMLTRSQGDYPEAERLYLRSMELNERAGEPMAVAGVATALGGLYHSMGRFDEGLAQVQRAIEIYDRHLEVEDGRVSDAYHNLGVMLRDHNRLKEAEVALRKALAIDEATFGSDHHLIASSLESLASVLWALEKHEQARPLVERARAIYLRTLGPDHPRVADCLNTLAMLHWSQGRAGLAEECAREALAIYRRALGDDHPFVGDLLGNLGAFVAGQGRHQEAVEILEGSLTVVEETRGPDHPNVATTLHHLAVALRELGQHERAEALFVRAISIRETALGPDNPRVADSLEAYALLLDASGRTGQAEQLERRVETIRAAASDRVP